MPPLALPNQGPTLPKLPNSPISSPSPAAKPPTAPPQGWVPMPSIASQLETDPAKQQIHQLKNLITTNAGHTAVKAPPLQPPSAKPVTPVIPKLPKLASNTLDIPNIKQTTNYSCGPAAFKAINDYLDGPQKTEDQLCEEMNAQPEVGTNPDNIIQQAHNHGFNSYAKHNMSTEELKKCIDEQKPVIIAIQAWGEPDEYDENKHGHYIIAIGYDNDNIYFADPSLKGARGSIPITELDKRWHDTDNNGHAYDHYGIVIWDDENSPSQKQSSMAKSMRQRILSSQNDNNEYSYLSLLANQQFLTQIDLIIPIS